MASVRTPVPHSRRWAVRVVMVVAVLAQLFACQSHSAIANASVPAAVQDLGHGLGHDALCEAASSIGSAAASVAGPPLIAVAVVGLLVWLWVGLVAPVTGGPPWAPRRTLTGRRRLSAVAIIRV